MEISLENLHVYKVLPYAPVRIPSKSQHPPPPPHLFFFGFLAIHELRKNQTVYTGSYCHYVS